ncbi:HEAT repeat domain-containing protein, partial [Asticcacaulis sp. AC460]|uniref:HEAT repeat domain-containing protein n=1 Tax=Asticcacaulis sp. AC460 TaxID=1282360 RepID=UPI00054D00B1
MSPSASGFELAFLRAIWIGTAVLCVAAIAIMLVLVARRAASSADAVQRDARRQSLSRFILAALKSPVALDAAALPPVTPADFPILVSLALDMLRSLRGGDAVRICSLLKLWGVEPYLLAMAARGRPGKRIRAVTLLGFFDDDTSLQVLLATARDREMYVQIAALRALAQRGAADHIDTITDSLAHSGQTNTLLLHDILQRFGASAVPALARLASSPASAEVRTAAVMAPGSIGAV